MISRRILQSLTLGLMLGSVVGVAAADGGTNDSHRGTSLTLGDMLLGLLRDGIQLAPPISGTNHSAHFSGADSPQFAALAQLNTEIGRQIAATPLSSSAGGFVFRFDPTLGQPVRQTRSFGPVFAERPLTVGEGRFSVGVNYSQFSFDGFDDVSLRTGEMRLIFTHDDVDPVGPNNPAYEGDVIESIMYLNVDLNVTSFVASYGVSDRLDVAVAVPHVEIDMAVSLDSEIQALATADSTTGESTVHEFTNGTQRSVTGRQGSASGFGDVAVRGKYRLSDADASTALGLAAEVRFPTGDELDLLGTGEYQFRGSLLAAMGRSDFSPHLNLGGGFGTGDLPSEVSYAAGFDWALDPKLTIAADVVGHYRLDTTEIAVEESEFEYLDGASTETATFELLTADSDAGGGNVLNGAIGLKLNVWEQVIITANGLFPLSSTGLHDDFASLVGVDVAF